MNLREIDFTRSDSHIPGGAVSRAAGGRDGADDNDIHSAMDFADRSHFTHTQTRTRGSHAVDTEGDEADASLGARRAVLSVVDSFVSPLGVQLDHDLLFSASVGPEGGSESTSGSTEYDGPGNMDDDPDAGMVDDADGIGMAITLADWADAERVLQGGHE
ncbi:hypothetical protein GY45DRAFT_726147 [Cubamyces sp. BRFM 1775]|nr:hypothetical protein GY45DRAFT_726147 [Cubamyces sp. BRFM 1775]